MKNLFILIAFLFLSALPAAAESEATSADKVRLGMLLPLSGSYAPIGLDNRQGIEIALAELANDKIVPVYGDSRTEPVQAIHEFRRMVNVDKVSAVFAFRGPVGMALNPVSQKSNVPLLGGVGNKKFAAENEYAFQMWTPSNREGAFIANQFLEQEGKRIGLVTVQDDWTASVSDGFRKELEKHRKPPVFDQEVAPGETDFRSIVLKLKASNADALFVNVGFGQIAPLLRQIKEQNIQIPIISNMWVNKPEVIESAGISVVEDVMFVEMDTSFPALRKELKERYDSTPSGATISAYVATMLMGQAAKAIEGDFTSEKLYQSLNNKQNVVTRNGEFLVKDRVVQFNLVIKKLRGGKATTL